jgi:hypothetical protein
MTDHLKRGTHVTYRFAAGKIVTGVVVKRHQGFLDDQWYALRLSDEVGTWSGSCHREQITVTDNRGRGA